MLRDLKLMLEIALDDTSKDSVLKLIISTAQARLKILLGGLEPPESLDYIIREVAIKRYNKIGSEGMEMHIVEGENQHFSDDDFAEFTDEIEAFLAAQKNSAKGRVRFL